MIKMTDNELAYRCSGKKHPKLEIIFNNKSFQIYQFASYYEENEIKGQFLEVLPGIFYKEKKRLDKKAIDKGYNKVYDVDGKSVGKISDMLIFSIKCLRYYNIQSVEVSILIKNKRDKVRIVETDLKSNLVTEIFYSEGIRKHSQIIDRRAESKYDEMPAVRKYVPTDKIIYPDTLGGGANRCIVWNYFQRLGLMSTFNHSYKIFNVETMLNSTENNKNLLLKCEKFGACSVMLKEFNEGKYEVDFSKESFSCDNIQLTEFEGHFIPYGGLHGVCLAKRFGINKVSAEVSQCVNIKQYKKYEIKNDMTSSFDEILKNCYDTFENVKMKKSDVHLILENGLSDEELINYIENKSGKTISELAGEFKPTLF